MTVAADLTRLSRLRLMLESGEAAQIRQAARLTVREVAQSIGILPDTLYRWECGSRTASGAPALAYLDLLESLSGTR